MSKYIIIKSGPLKGTVKIEGAKNSALPIMAASLLVDGTCYIEEVPPLEDVKTMIALLSSLGVKISYPTDSTVMLDCSKIDNTEAPYDIVSKMRASFLILGPMLARMKRMKICLPGGCAIGSRPIDLHLKGLQALGAVIKQEFGYIEAYTDGLVGNKIYLDFPSVGATENIMMAAALARGATVIENAATEPEIVDLANYLNAMGASIRGSGTDTIKIDGVTALHEAQHTVIPDRIEAGTFMVAAAITQGEIFLENIMIDHLKPIIAKLREMGVKIEEKEKGLWVKGVEKLTPTDVTTLPYPGFPTDMQAQFMALMSIVEGTSVLVETVFENRFMHVGEFKRMGGNIRVEGRSAVIEGVPMLLGAQIKATDLRAGAAMILCGLIAEGVTEIRDIKHIDRGYHNLHRKLEKLGANITRVED